MTIYETLVRTSRPSPKSPKTSNPTTKGESSFIRQIDKGCVWIEFIFTETENTVAK